MKFMLGCCADRWQSPKLPRKCTVSQSSATLPCCRSLNMNYAFFSLFSHHIDRLSEMSWRTKESRDSQTAHLCAVVKWGNVTVHSTFNQKIHVNKNLDTVSNCAALAKLSVCVTHWPMWDLRIQVTSADLFSSMWRKIDFLVLIVGLLAIGVAIVTADNNESFRDSITFTVFAKYDV